RRRRAKRRRERRRRANRRLVGAHHRGRQDREPEPARHAHPRRHGEGAAGQKLVADLLKLRGARALSEFRLAKLVAQLQKVAPGVRSVASEHWHFVELRRPLAQSERGLLERLLGYGAGKEPEPAHESPELVVVPRLGTISPWSSKATDIARNCGLDA